jgi:hypothetical protein
MWHLILYAVGAVVGLCGLAVLGVEIAARVHARRTPEPTTEADAIRENRRTRLRKSFPGLLPGGSERALTECCSVAR